jgi:RNA polymerase sigma-70 factor (ECF subfamily)
VPLSATAADDEQESAALDRVVAAGRVLGGSMPGPTPEHEAEWASIRRVIQDALEGMADHERTVIVLAYHEELSQTEIAQRLGWPLGTVKTRTRRALLRLRQVLAAELGEPIERTPVEAGTRGNE